MKAKPTSDEPLLARRKLVDRLAPSAQLGPLMGILATTYEFDPEFFETDWLPTLLGLGAWDDRNWTSRVAIEKALDELEGAVVFADARRYRGRPRSLRVEVEPVCLPMGASFHAKVLLLVHRDAVRLHVASANLTEAGYRRNREVAAPLVATASRPEHAGLIAAAIEGMKAALEPWWTETAEVVFQAARGLLHTWPRPKVSDQLLWGATGASPLNTLVQSWPEGEAVQRITIVSPFWSEEDGLAGPLSGIAGQLRDRGALGSRPEVRLLTEAKSVGEERYLPVLPESFATLDAGRLGVRAVAVAVDPRVLPDEVDSHDGLVRPLHAKVILLEGPTTSVAYLGSANFTQRAWGLIQNGPQNIEAGFVLRRQGAARSQLTTLVPATIGVPVPLTGAAQSRIGLYPSSEPAKAWPPFLAGVQLVPSAGHPERLVLQVSVVLGAIKGPWSISSLGEGEEPTLIDLPGSPAERDLLVDLSPELLAQLLRDEEVRVRWWTLEGDRNVPINVARSARDALPLVPGSAKPGESMLIAYYQGQIAFGDLYPDPEAGAPGGEAASAPAPELGGVDTTRIQSYQVREFVEALRGIRDDLRSAARSTPRAMEVALRGAVSPLALARVVANEVTAARRTATAGAFQLFEILCCLFEARFFPTPPQHTGIWRKHTGETARSVDGLLASLFAASPETGAGAFRRYERALRAHYRSLEAS